MKASPAFGPRRLHTNTVYVVFARVVVVVVGEGEEGEHLRD